MRFLFVVLVLVCLTRWFHSAGKNAKPGVAIDHTKILKNLDESQRAYDSAIEKMEDQTGQMFEELLRNGRTMGPDRTRWIHEENGGIKQLERR
ncbi:MAG: hypothetical protein U0795_26385 [Pirellulales bacterium]